MQLFKKITSLVFLNNEMKPYSKLKELFLLYRGVPESARNTFNIPRGYTTQYLELVSKAIIAETVKKQSKSVGRVFLGDDEKKLKIGFFGNIANNLYITVKGLRKAGYDAELVIENGYFDEFLMYRPFWEDVDVQCTDYEDGLKYEDQWTKPAFVKCVSYDHDLTKWPAQIVDKVNAIRKCYKQTFGQSLNRSLANIMPQFIGHWSYLEAMNDYDVVVLSGPAIQMGPFCPKPYVIFPTGGDLLISPYDQNVVGYMFKLSYLMAKSILVGTSRSNNYQNNHLKQLGVFEKIKRVYMLYDTDLYAPKNQDKLRQGWKDKVGGQCFIVCICRQDWEWKANDIFLRGFAQSDLSDTRIVLLEWGEDIDKTKELIQKLDISSKVIWEPLSSKGRLRKIQQAADIVVDQLAVNSYSTSAFESMSVATPVIMRYPPPDPGTDAGEQAPIMHASNEAEVVEVLRYLDQPENRKKIGDESRKWIQEHRSYVSGSQRYVEALTHHDSSPYLSS